MSVRLIGWKQYFSKITLQVILEKLQRMDDENQKKEICS